MKGSVYKRGKTWTYMFDGPPDPLTGKRKLVTKGGFKEEGEAWKACRAAITRAEEGHHVTPSRRTVATYLLNEWLPAIKNSTAATTWGNWQTNAKAYVVPYVGKVKLQTLTAPQLQALYDRLLTNGRVKADLTYAMFKAWTELRTSGREPTARQVAVAAGTSIHAAKAAARRFRAGHVPAVKPLGLEPKTVRNVHTMLYAALSNAVGWRYVVENVAAHVNPPKVKRRKATVWTPAQMRKFLTFIAGDRFYALFLLGATTGLRRSELVGIRWPAIDLDGRTLTVHPDTLVVVNGRAEAGDGKTDNAPRLISLDMATVAALRAWKTEQDSEHAFFDRDYLGTDRIFTWENGRDVHPDVVRQRFNRLTDRAGLPRIRLYDVRHTYATTALKSGVNPKIVSARLGHASVGFTLSVYSHALPGMDREASTEIAGMFVDQPEAEPPKDANDGPDEGDANKSANK
ncbi:MAG TPA: tyrosine-type recombinase/integrase [Candidatus Limnocylindrales bacterium]|nr:tyrosine-type recombinase/integrase [Candidatus Limnocylindrales bacterium]